MKRVNSIVTVGVGFRPEVTVGKFTDAKNIGVILPSGKKVRLTNFPSRSRTVWVEIKKGESPLSVCSRLNELYSRHVSSLAEYRLEDVREFLLTNGKKKLIAYRVILHISSLVEERRNRKKKSNKKKEGE